MTKPLALVKASAAQIWTPEREAVDSACRRIVSLLDSWTMEDSPQVSDVGGAAREARSRFQFSLRSLLAVTALAAWLLGTVGEEAAAVLVIIAWLTVVEVGCTPHANLGNALVRNFSYFRLFADFRRRGLRPDVWRQSDRFVRYESVPVRSTYQQG